MRHGDTLANRFVIERLAGSGGMGEVYRAADRQTGQPVAIKVLLGEQEGDVARFEREARILSAIAHPNIVRYVTRGVLPEGDPYLVMEWLEGEDLAARLARGPLPAADAVALAAAVAEALGALHEQGIVHRDLKPSNVFLARGRIDDIKLLDFGIARSNAATRLTGTGHMLGTAAYMAPEQASGASTLDARADVFALGCTLFECLTGEKAFDGAHVMAILTKILFNDAPRLEEKLPGLPGPLCALVDRMLSKSPQERPANGRAVAMALRGLGDVRNAQLADTLEAPPPAALTRSEQRAVAVIFIGPAAAGVPANDERLAAEAAAHGGRFERLFDGSAAVLLSGPQVATDLAAQAARCALSLGRHAHGRRITLAIGRGEETGRLPVGPAIDRAARLLGGQDAGQTSSAHVRLDDAAVGLLDARFEVLKDSGVFVLRAERDVAEVRTLLGKPTPCVGRDRELRHIEASFDDCASEGRARAVLVTGPAGMGKSRIGREIVQRLRARGEPISVWIARGELLGAGSALGMLAELVREACGIQAGEPLEMRRDKLRARVEERLPERDRRRVTEFLGEIIGASFPDEGSLPLASARQDAQLMSDQIRAAFIDFLGAECEVTPVLVLLEDLHWGDGATVRILDAALRDLQEKPVFVFALARPEVHDVFPRLWADRGYEQICLNQLGKKASEQLVRHVLGERVAPEALERVVRLADGNAFYLEELIRATAEGRGADLPETVVAMVQSRLAGLHEIQRRILRAASVFGNTFWSAGVAALLGDTTGATNVASRLRELVEGELVTVQRQSRFAAEEEYAFRHALVREGAYAMLTEGDLRLGHRLAGEWLEQHGETDPLVLAGHFQKGGDDVRAAGFYLRAAEMANGSGDSESAIAHARQGLGCGPSQGTRVELLGVLCEASAWNLEMSAAALPDAQDLLRIAPDGSKAWIQSLFAKLAGASVLGRGDEMLSVVDALAQSTPAPGGAGLFVFVCGAAAYVLDTMGRVSQADALLERASRVSQHHGANTLARAHYNSYRALRIMVNGRGSALDALQHTHTLSVFFQAIGHRRLFAAAAIIGGMSEWCLGVPEVGVAGLEQQHLPDEELGHLGDVRCVALGWLLADSGALEKALGAADARIRLAQAWRIPPSEARGRWVRAEVLRRAGDLEAAEREIQSALAMAVPLDQPGVLASMAALRLAQGRPAEALVAAQEGMTKYEHMGACSFFRAAFVRLVHAECLQAAGDHEGAKAAITRSREWLLGVAAQVGDDEYRKSFLANVPENRRLLELAERWVGPSPA
ncbi:serine/threonine-protein kinase [Polyangium aurulentum]|uniref:serine/threonine-protein kinase n=1 Tax=Polyangium aurulentum TaxID=2567896 RepID=UPI0010AE0382|nr:serine/threonine-protein kinase [Polyangium aurulentum]UQA59484.1 protein kinase [Polyangium aurulentum]